MSRLKKDLPKDAVFFGNYTTSGGELITDYGTALAKAEKVDSCNGTKKWYPCVIEQVGNHFVVEEYYKG